MRRVRYGGGHSWDVYEYEFEVPDNMSGYEIYCEVQYKREGFGGDPYDDWWATNPPVETKIAWIDRGNNKGMKCSACGFPIRYKNAIPNTHAYYDYCPKCGTSMGHLQDYTTLSNEEWQRAVEKDSE